MNTCSHGNSITYRDFDDADQVSPLQLLHAVIGISTILVEVRHFSRVRSRTDTKGERPNNVRYALR